MGEAQPGIYAGLEANLVEALDLAAPASGIVALKVPEAHADQSVYNAVDSDLVVVDLTAVDSVQALDLEELKT